MVVVTSAVTGSDGGGGEAAEGPAAGVLPRPVLCAGLFVMGLHITIVQQLEVLDQSARGLL